MAGSVTYWVLKNRVTGMYVKDEFGGKRTLVPSLKEATSFGMDTARAAAKLDGTLRSVKVTRSKVTKPTAPVVKRVTHVGICVDGSVSMAGWETQVTKQIADVLDSVRKSVTPEHKVTVSIWTLGKGSGRSPVSINYYTKNPNGMTDTLSHEIVEECFNVDAADAKYTTYRASGSTPLSDCIGNAIERLMSIKNDPGVDVAYLLQVVTDGEENSSTKFSTPLCASAIKARQATDRWTFAFAVPPFKKRDFARLYSLPEGNIQEWEQSSKGFREVTNQWVGATDKYLVTRSAGTATNTTAYFTTDLSGIDSGKLSRLSDVTLKVKPLKVDKEIGLKEFIEAHGDIYRKGDVYFTLTKQERVSADKKIVVRDKKTGHAFTGSNVRSVLGLPSTDAKFKPGNHGWVDLFIQSTSDNRKLVRGTEVLVVKSGCAI